ncbi:hypothetical protein [Geminocystis herdmanii]|uniref:hypothetical protein n=1 Tax=Geminocystis herdmanii TaxID=669359 RepID=UPI000344AC54|nr:hypothetical protein [Geminocystis herdmanii]
MKLLYLSKDKVLGSFVTALIADNLSSNLHQEKIIFSENNHFINLLNNIYNLNSILQYNSSIELFPLMIYSYENRETLEIINQLKKEQKAIEILIIIVNLILVDRINFDEPIQQIIEHLETKDISIINNLNQLDRILKNQETLTIVNEIFNTEFDIELQEIYQALYIFFSNPYHLENSLQRSQYFVKKTQETIILSGYLLGLYHGYSKLPYQWHNILNLNPENTEIEILTEKLVAQWQGKMENK